MTVNLLNANNQIVATTVTDANGDYAFNDLRPGVNYSVQEIVPAHYFAEDAVPGDAGGTATDAEDIVGLTLAPGQASMCYDFYIMPPASLTGRVMVNLTGLNCNESVDFARRSQRDRQSAQCQQSNRGHHRHRLRRRLRLQQSDARPIQHPRDCLRRAILPRTRRRAMPAGRPPTPRTSSG